MKRFKAILLNKLSVKRIMLFCLAALTILLVGMIVFQSIYQSDVDKIIKDYPDLRQTKWQSKIYFYTHMADFYIVINYFKNQDVRVIDISVKSDDAISEIYDKNGILSSEENISGIIEGIVKDLNADGYNGVSKSGDSVTIYNGGYVASWDIRNEVGLIYYFNDEAKDDGLAKEHLFGNWYLYAIINKKTAQEMKAYEDENIKRITDYFNSHKEDFIKVVEYLNNREEDMIIIQDINIINGEYEPIEIDPEISKIAYRILEECEFSLIMKGKGGVSMDTGGQPTFGIAYNAVPYSCTTHPLSDGFYFYMFYRD